MNNALPVTAQSPGRLEAEALIEQIRQSRGFSRNEAVTAVVMLDNRERYFGRAPLTAGLPLQQVYAPEMDDPLDAHLTTDQAARVIAYVYECSVEDAAAHLAQQVESGACQLETMQ